MTSINQSKDDGAPVVNYVLPTNHGPREGAIHFSQHPGMGYLNSAAQLSNSNLTVVVQQPRADDTCKLMVGTIHGHRGWSTGIFECCTDCSNCMFTWCCYPCALSRLASRTGECCCTPCCVPGSEIALRARIRTLGGIQGSLCSDCCTVCWCAPCAACQMSRELDNMCVS